MLEPLAVMGALGLSDADGDHLRGIVPLEDRRRDVETLDWAAALAELDVAALDPLTVSDTLGVLLKYQDDIARIQGGKVKDLIDEVRSELRAAE